MAAVPSPMGAQKFRLRQRKPSFAERVFSPAAILLDAAFLANELAAGTLPAALFSEATASSRCTLLARRDSPSRWLPLRPVGGRILPRECPPIVIQACLAVL